MTQERSIAGGRSKRVSMTSSVSLSKLDAVLTSLAPFQGELLSITMQALIDLLDGVCLRIS